MPIVLARRGQADDRQALAHLAQLSRKRVTADPRELQIDERHIKPLAARRQRQGLVAGLGRNRGKTPDRDLPLERLSRADVIGHDQDALQR